VLNAAIRGKLRGEGGSHVGSRQLREAVKENEDFLTSSVLARLLYLPEATFWDLISTATLAEEGPKAAISGAGRVVEHRFWPSYALQRADAEFVGRREPDLVIEFENLILIVEAKLETNRQDASQWADQIVAVAPTLGSRTPPVMYLAVGGLGRIPQRSTLRELQEQAGEALATKPTGGITFLACSWHQLASSVSAVLSSPRPPHEVRVLRDIEAALSLYDVRPTSWLESMAKPNEFAGFRSSTLETLSAWNQRPHLGVKSSSDLV